MRKNASNRHRLKIASETDDPEMLDLLSRDSDMGVRQGVSTNPNTPIEALIRLSGDIQSWVRAGAAHNRRTPAEILDQLSRESDSRIRQSVSWNPNTPIETLVRLSRDSEMRCRWGVSQHPNTPIETLVALRMDPHASVRTDANRNLHRIKESRPELRDQIEELETLAELGIRADGDPIDPTDLEGLDI